MENGFKQTLSTKKQCLTNPGDFLLKAIFRKNPTASKCLRNRQDAGPMARTWQFYKADI